MVLAGVLVAQSTGAGEGKVHLFILSGQSNMAGLNPNVSFTPTVKAALGADEAIVIKDAVGGQPIRRWYKKWRAAGGGGPKATGDLYDRLMGKVRSATRGKDLATVTFVWMQGERDARENHGEVYAASMRGLVDQLQADMGRDDVGFVIGRLSDCRKGGHWEKVRRAQVEVADASPRGRWVDTDDLNGPRNGLHYTRDGYKTLGERFAKAAVELVRATGVIIPDFDDGALTSRTRPILAMLKAERFASAWAALTKLDPEAAPEKDFVARVKPIILTRVERAVEEIRKLDRIGDAYRAKKLIEESRPRLGGIASFDEAVEPIRKALARYPKSSEVTRGAKYYYLMSLAGTKQHAQAVLALTQFAKRYPKSAYGKAAAAAMVDLKDPRAKVDARGYVGRGE
ncbi:MAG: sialate O-acetylesterase [Planctomycetota bacterium]|jgi:hypothetical protein